MKRAIHFILGGVLLCAGCAGSGVGVRAAGTTPAAGPGEMPRLPAESLNSIPVPVERISGPGEVAEPVPGGVIDWSANLVRARGSGVVDPGDPNPARARLMAERAAVVVAQRNLLEIIKGVRVDADTKVENFITKYDIVSTHIEGVVKGARMVGPATFDSNTGVVEVELEANLAGPQSVAAALAPAIQIPGAGVSAGGVTPAVQEFFERYSALVLDAGNTGLKPALFPKIYDEAGNLLLDTKDLYEYTGDAGERLVRYIGRLDALLSRPEFARQPLVLKIKQVRGKLGADIILGKEDADKLKWLKQGARLLFDAGRFFVKLLL